MDKMYCWPPKGPQGKALAHLFAHLLMFLDVSVCAVHIQGNDNIITDYLPCLCDQNDF
jgi:hypothetical protein